MNTLRFNFANCLSFCQSFPAVAATTIRIATQIATPSIQSTCDWPLAASYTPRDSEITAAMVSRIMILSLYASQRRRRNVLRLGGGIWFSPKTRMRSANWDGNGSGCCDGDGDGGDGEEDSAFKYCSVTSANPTYPHSTPSSAERPARRSVRRPYSSPRRPPRARNAARDLGFSSLFRWPGV